MSLRYIHTYIHTYIDTYIHTCRYSEFAIAVYIMLLLYLELVQARPKLYGSTFTSDQVNEYGTMKSTKGSILNGLLNKLNCNLVLGTYDPI